MLLPLHELELFFQLHRALMLFVNQRLKVIPDDLPRPEDYASLSPEVQIKVRDAFLANTHLIESFVAENPAHLSENELDIVRSWRHLVYGKFYVLRDLAKHTVFLTTTDPSIAYGVVALSQPFEDLIGPYLPIMTQTVLLPFKGKIVYDGLMRSFNISFGPGIRRSLNKSSMEAKSRHGIVTSLPMPKELLPPKAQRVRPVPKPASREEKDAALGVITRLIEDFCQKHLNEEYALLCRKMAEKLARKRPSPLLHGSPNAWASGIVRAIGGVNFLHDKSQKPYMKSANIDHYLGTSPSSGAVKLAAIRKTLRIHLFDPTWTLPSRWDNHPMMWMIEVNGLMIDVRHAPKDVQEIAFKKGLIPYIPADQG